ncbi:Non-reducing end beta-L-arabinofuranosidase [Clavibacter michiganensis]|uniref:Non-reducing end beta-L-arabinofuranosidase n=1 Tax=Clavibacter michiganensis TaxID=28447 RepID=A0A251YWF6_9MICO|nr:beta-L-arabinofuranosidase domain-containing protein [Clavibacter michiganensis]OUE28398.1 Non-reducing end beta-L-arabinofuranosidase [Clavibacter michiganensis]
MAVIGARAQTTGDIAGRPAVDPATGRRRPLGSAAVTLESGLLAAWQERNRAETIPHAIASMTAAGNLDDLRAAIDGPGERPVPRYPFLDTDVYKTLEGIAYEVGRGSADAASRAFLAEATDVLERVQADDGYIGSYVQRPGSDRAPWTDLAWGHELYNLGHLIQAAVADSRQGGDGRLLAVARRFADAAVREFGAGGRGEVCGHPEVEMALVELFRETGERAYLDLASAFVDRRGHGTVATRIFPAEYFQDAHPFREMPAVTGHAVRMAYLAAGATDVATETGDAELLAASVRLFDDAVRTRLYVTGGLGSRHSDEAIGDAYELPSERSYSETCAAIAVMQWAWRLFLATGEPRFLDAHETVLLNAYAVGLSSDGTGFFYDNPLQRRPDHHAQSGAETEGELMRRPWFTCPCCPPNIVRWMSELQDHVAVRDGDDLVIAHPTACVIRTDAIDVRVTTAYPWDGGVRVEVLRASGAETGLVIRRPGWCRAATAVVEAADGSAAAGVDAMAGDRWIRATRPWAVGDALVVELHMPVRALGSHPHLDATRGSLAVARGPVVYAVEQQDAGAPVDDLLLDPRDLAGARTVPLPLDDPWGPASDAADPASGVALAVRLHRSAPAPDELYPEVVPGATAPAPSADPVDAVLVPYALWGNRSPAAMRVWIRAADSG